MLNRAGDVERNRRRRWRRVAGACWLVLLTPVVGLANLVAHDYGTGILYSVSTEDASLSVIGNTGISSLGSLELGPDGYLYGFTTGDDPSLYRIDPADASTSEVGPLNVGFVFEGGLAFAPDGTVYATNQDEAENPVLFAVDLLSGAATTIATISGGAHDLNGLAWRHDGMLVGIDRETNALLAIDPVTATSTVIATVRPMVGAIGGMAVLEGTGHFSTSGPGGPDTETTPGSNELYSFDLFTGDHVLIGSFSPTITGDGIGGLAVPEPSTLVLLAGGLWLTHRGNRWRRR